MHEVVVIAQQSSLGCNRCSAGGTLFPESPCKVKIGPANFPFVCDPAPSRADVEQALAPGYSGRSWCCWTDYNLPCPALALASVPAPAFVWHTHDRDWYPAFCACCCEP